MTDAGNIYFFSFLLLHSSSIRHLNYFLSFFCRYANVERSQTCENTNVHCNPTNTYFPTECRQRRYLRRGAINSREIAKTPEQKEISLLNLFGKRKATAPSVDKFHLPRLSRLLDKLPAFQSKRKITKNYTYISEYSAVYFYTFLSLLHRFSQTIYGVENG